MFRENKIKMDHAKSFYDRFKEIHRETHYKLVNALLQPFVRPQDYFKGTGILESSYFALSEDISGYLKSSGTEVNEDFDIKLRRSFSPKNGSFSKRPLLVIEYGRTLADNVPDKIFERFDNGWEAIYFLAGVWAAQTNKFVGGRYSRKNLLAWNIPMIVSWTMDKGLIRLNNVSKLGKKLPHEEDIRTIIEFVNNPHRDQMSLDLIIE